MLVGLSSRPLRSKAIRATTYQRDVNFRTLLKKLPKYLIQFKSQLIFCEVINEQM